MNPLPWHPCLLDPNDAHLPSYSPTMVIDKGLGLHAFYDLLEQSAPYMRWIKLGFGSGVLYPPHVLTRKIAFAQEAGVHVMFGGTLFEIALMHGQSDHFF